MKRKQRIIAIILLCTALVIMGIVQCFAYQPDIESIPNDLGQEITDLNNIPNGFYYVKMTITERIDQQEIFKFTVKQNDTTGNYMIATYNQDALYITVNNVYTDYVLARPISYSRTNTYPMSFALRQSKTTFYIAFAIASRTNYNRYINLVASEENNVEIKLYYIGDTGIDYDYAYMQGYLSGYNEGFDNGQNIQQYTNLVGYVEQLIGQFTGTEVAQYITPIAIVLVVLFVYFLFIRFLLSLIKAKGVIKTCDIIMIVACIIMLVVMYAPMLDLTIKTEQVNKTETTQVVEQVNRTQIRIEHTETGDIYYGPVGTAIVPVYEVAEDTVTKQVNTESEQYEKS